MPNNCSKDYEAIIDHVDSVFLQGTDQDKATLREMFAVQELEHDDDAASAIVGIPFSHSRVSNKAYEQSVFTYMAVAKHSVQQQLQRVLPDVRCHRGSHSQRHGH